MTDIATTQATLGDVLGYIRRADESELRVMSEELRQRNRRLRSVTAHQMGATLKIGDLVTVITGVKPKYLVGRTGRVASSPTSNHVKIDFGRAINARFGQVVGMPLSCLELVAK